jgi:hypothetical protein
VTRLFGISPKANKVEVFRHSRTNPSPISYVPPITQLTSFTDNRRTIPFVGAAVAQLAVTRSNDIANKNFDAIEYEATGDDFIQAFTKVHGSTTEVVELSEADWKTQLEAGGLTSLGGGYKRKWGDGDFTWIGEKVKVEGWESKSLEATAKMYV